MTPKQERFVEEYLIDLNATQAAIRAGYSEATAAEQGSRLLSNVKISDAVSEGRRKLSERTEITQERVLKELGKIGFANMDDYIRVGIDGDAFVDLSELDRDKAAAISEVTVEDFTDGRGEDSRDVRKIKFKLLDKRAALVDIGKHLGMFSDRIEHTGKNGGPIETADVTESHKERLAAAVLRDLGIKSDEVGE
jgi:phage terminase small subunit